MPSLDIKDYALIGLSLIIAILLYANSSLKDDIEDLEVNIAKLNEKVGICKANNFTLNNAIEAQNKKLETLSLDYDEALEKYNKEKNKKSKIIEKIVKVRSDDCSDIKDTIDAVRSIDYNSL